MSSAGDINVEARFARRLALAIGALILIRLLIAALFSFSFDEALLVVKAHHRHLSYFDHPPLASLLIAAVQGLTGSDAPIVLRLPTIALFAGTTWLVFRIGAVLFSPQAGFYGAVALSLSPLFSFYFGVFAVTDAPMLFCVASGTLCLCHALFLKERSPLLWWLAAGLFAGLALLSKSYSAALVVIGMAGFLLSTPQHRYWLRRPAPYLAAAIMLITLTPIFVWNANNEWINFLFPGGHPLQGGWTFAPLRVLTYWGTQALVALPWIWLGLVAAVIWGLSRGPRDDRVWFLACLAAVPLVAFTLLQLFSTQRAGYHWAAPGYLLSFPLLGVMIERASARYWPAIQHLWRASVVVLAVALVVVATHILTGWTRQLIPAFERRDPIIPYMAAWDGLQAAIDRHRSNARGDDFVVGMRWEHCAKIEVHIRMAAPVLCLTPFPEIFAYLVDPRPLLGRNAIIVVAQDGPNAAELLSAYFERVEPLERLTITHFGTRALVLEIYRGHNLRGIYAWPYGPYRALARLPASN